MVKIRLITYSANGQQLVSHGVEEDSLKNVCLPPEPLSTFNPKRDGLGFYIYAGTA